MRAKISTLFILGSVILVAALTVAINKIRSQIFATEIEDVKEAMGKLLKEFLDILGILIFPLALAILGVVVMNKGSENSEQFVQTNSAKLDDAESAESMTSGNGIRKSRSLFGSRTYGSKVG